MTTTIGTVTKAEVRSLISSGAWGNLEPVQLANLQHWLKQTTIIWAGKVDGELVCIFGVVPPTLAADYAYLWLWETEKVRDHQFIFVRKSQMVIAELLKRYDKIVGACREDAPRSRRWLRWLGAEFKEKRDGYIPFVIRGT